MAPRLVPIIALVSTLAFAGCGDDKTTGEASTPAPAPAASSPLGTTPAKATPSPGWATEVNTMCRENKARTEALQKDVKAKVKGTANERNAAVLKEFLPSGRKFVADLRAVDVPADVKSAYEEYVDAIGESIELLPDSIAAAEAGKADEKIAQKYVKIGNVTKAFSDKYGLADCGNAAS